MKTALRWLGKGVAAAIALILLYQLWIFAHVLWWIDHNPTSTAFMEAGLARQQDKNPDAELRHKWVPYDKISIHLKRALVAAETRSSSHTKALMSKALKPPSKRI